MATAFVTEQRVKAAVTPRAIEQAKARAIELMKEAYCAKPVPIEGQLTMICLSGRIARGYDKLAIARRSDNAAAVKKLEQGVKMLTDQYQAAIKAAEMAASDWAAMAAAAGVTVNPMDVYQAACECETCQANAKRRDQFNMRDVYRDVVFDFLAPNSFDVPPLVALMRDAKDKDQRDILWAHLKRIWDAAEGYIKACEQEGKKPNWRVALFPSGDGE